TSARAERGGGVGRAAPRLLAVGVGILGGVAARLRAPLAVLALRAGRQVVGRGHLQLVAAVGATVGAGGDVAAGGNGFSHGGHIPSFSIRTSPTPATARFAAPAIRRPAQG